MAALIPVAAAMCAPGCASAVATGVAGLVGTGMMASAAPILAVGASAAAMYSYMRSSYSKESGEENAELVEEEGLTSRRRAGVGTITGGGTGICTTVKRELGGDPFEDAEDGTAPGTTSDASTEASPKTGASFF